MIQKLLQEVERRNIAKNDFYLGSLGSIVKKHRLKRSMTQETLAKGICSNTYLSKFENNAAPINLEFIDLIMERMDIKYENFMLPNEMLNIFEKALDYYIHDDLSKYDLLLHSVKDVEFAILVDIARLGFHVTSGNKKESLEISDNLFHFLSSMDAKALSVFMVFSSAAKILNHQYSEALKILELFNDFDSPNSDLIGIIAYQKFVCYGHLGLINQSRSSAEEAKNEFVKSKNYRRLALIDYYQIIFSFFENESIGTHSNSNFIKLLNQDERDFYNIIMSLGGETSVSYLDEIPENSKYYTEAIFLNCWNQLNTQKLSNYEKLKDELYQICLNNQNVIVNYHHWLVLIELNANHDLRNFLLTYILPLAYQYESVYLLKKLSHEIARFSLATKRYKDAIYEIFTIENEIAKLQNIKKPIEIIKSQSDKEFY